jgi:hypothetical protein
MAVKIFLFYSEILQGRRRFFAVLPAAIGFAWFFIFFLFYSKILQGRGFRRDAACQVSTMFPASKKK